MPHRFSSLRVALLFLFTGLGLAAPNGLPAQLRIAARPGGDEQALRLVLSRGQAEGDFSLVLINEGEQPLRLDGVSAFLVPDDQTVLPNCQVQLLQAASRQPLGNLTLPPQSRTPVVLRVQGLDRVGEFQGQLQYQLSPAANPPANDTSLAWRTLGAFTLVRPGQVRIRGITGSPSDPTIRVNVAGANLAANLYLHESQGRADVPEVQLQHGPLVRSDGLPSAEARFTWSAADGSQQALQVAAAADTVVQLQGLLPLPGTYSTWLTLTYQGQADHYTLEIIRPPASPLSVLEAQADKLVLASSGTSLQASMTVINPAGQPDVASLTVQISNLRRADGQALGDATLVANQAAAEPLPGGGSLVVDLLGEQLAVGNYQATLTLLRDGTPQRLSVEVIRSPPRQDLELVAPKPANVRSWPFRAQATLDVIVRQKEGRQTQIQPPSFHLQRTSGVQSQAVGRFDMSLSRRLADGTLQAVADTSGATGSHLTPVDAQGEVAFTARFSNLGAGTYEGEVVVWGPQSERQVKPIQIKVKDHWLGALLTVLAGVGMAFGLHWFVRLGRSILVRNAMIAEERQELSQHYRPPPIDDGWENLLGRLDKLLNQSRFQRASNQQVTESLKDLKLRRQRYLELRAASERVTQLLDSLVIDANKLREHRNEQMKCLETGLAALKKETLNEGLGNGEADLPAQIVKLDQLGRTISQQAVLVPLQALRDQLDQLAWPAQPPVHVAEQVTSITKQLDEIEQRVNEGAARTPELERLESARCQYARLRTGRLNWQAERLEAQLPDRTEGETSEALQAAFQRLDRARELAVETEVPGDSARLLELCQQGEHQLLGAQIMHLAFLASDAARPDVIETPEEWRRIVAATPLGAQLASAERDWGAGQADRAIGHYERARQSWSRVQETVLDHRLKQTRQLFSGRHYLDDAEYGALVKQLDAISTKLPTAAEPSDARTRKLTQARVELVQAQLAALEAAGSQMQKEYNANQAEKTSPGSASDVELEVWSNKIPGLLQELKKGLDASTQSMLRFTGSDDKEATLGELAAAEEQASEALLKYEQVWKLLKQSVRMSVSDVKQLLESMVPRGARVSAETDPATSGPDASSSRPPERGLFAPAASVAPAQLPPDKWYRLVQLGDCLTLVVALVVAALVGLLGVWGTNPTFGHFDYATAFLWGFGSHEGVKGITLLGEQFGLFPKQQG